MRTLFLCLFLSLLPLIAFGQDCNPNSCPNMTCPAGVSPVCTESGYWVCGCAASDLGTCYANSDCGNENYSCEENCCVDNAGCSQGACMETADCGTDGEGWSCVDNCCVSSSGNGNGNGGGGGGNQWDCQTDMDCPGCQSCDGNGNCYDDNSWCDTGIGEWCYDARCYMPGDDPLLDPIVIDLDGDTFALTDLQHGVKFDFFGTGKPQRISWTSAGSNVGWLALDLNGDGRIDNGFELFSNIAKQPQLSPASVSFKALAQYDLKANGGNGDGVIDKRDKVFSRLRLWVDKNHNGISESGELLTLQQAGIQSISLNYQSMNWTDAYGNRFGSRAAIVREGGQGGNGQWAYDVVLIVAR